MTIRRKLRGSFNKRKEKEKENSDRFKFLDPWLRTKFRARTSLTTFLE